MDHFGVPKATILEPKTGSKIDPVSGPIRVVDGGVLGSIRGPDLGPSLGRERIKERSIFGRRSGSVSDRKMGPNWLKRGRAGGVGPARLGTLGVFDQ